MAFDKISLNYINKSNDKNNSSILIFQENVATNFEETKIAWRVIENCGVGDNHPFTYDLNLQISSEDSWGNFTPKLSASTGSRFQMVRSDSGNILKNGSTSSSPKEVQLENNLSNGAINANIYRSGKLLARKTAISPAQMAVFEFKPVIYIGVASQIEEGDIINSAILQAINTKLSLLNVVSTDIVLTGGGGGTDSTSFKFTMQNIVSA